MIEKGRLEAFTDAIIAIAATIMVLELAAPDEVSVAVLFLWSLMYQILDNQLVKENPQIELDSTNGIKLRAAMYLGYLLAFVLSFIKPVLCMVVIIVVLVIITVHFLSIKKAARK